MDFKYKNIVFLTGAGISAESGVKTFRDSQGLWENHKVDDVANPRGFERNPALVWKFYSMRRKQANEVEPNKAHTSLAQTLKMLKQNEVNTYLITQNIDTLHERAFGALPNEDFIDIHGTLSRSRCTKCAKLYSDRWAYFDSDAKPCEWHADNLWSNAGLPCLLAMPRRNEQGIPMSPCCNTMLRPDTVWFGEKPHGVVQALDRLTSCDLFVSIGSSGYVHPASGFAAVAKKAGAHTVCINLEQPLNAYDFHEHFRGLATKKVPDFLKIFAKD